MLQDFLWTLNFCFFWPIMQIRKKGGWHLKKIFSFETTEPISTKLCWNDPWVVPFQNCVRQRVLYPRWPPLLKIEISSNGHNFKIVSVSAVLYPRWPPLLKIEISSNGQNCSILTRKCPNLNCIIMMCFLTYITRFFMNSELFPILTDYAN